MKTPPKDETLILGDFGYPWYMVCCWSEAEEKWSAAELASGVYRNKKDPGFETIWHDDKELKGWVEIPIIER